MCSITAESFKTGPMFVIGTSKAYASTREEDVTYVDQWALNELMSIDTNCMNTYLKDYSRSYYRKGFHLKSILEYNRDDPPMDSWNLDTVIKVKDLIRSEFSKANIQATSYDVLTELDKVPFVGSSAAGYKYDGKKGEYKGLNHKLAIKRAKKMSLDYFDSDGECLDNDILNSTPYLGFTRTQLTDITEKLKVRAVWGSPFHHILAEGLAAAPFIASLVENDCFIHYGGDPLNTVPQLINQLNHNYDWLYTFDWSKFDATTSRFEIDLAFELIKECITFPNRESECAFDLSVEKFKYKKVLGPDGNVYSCNTGVPSGSNWTSVVDSVINYFRIQYVWYEITGKFIKDLQTHGDDGVAGDKQYVSMYEFAQEAIKHGWILNPEKSDSTRDAGLVEFLGRNSTGGFSRRSIERCLRLLVYPEYPVESAEISSFRAESIYTDVGRNSEKLERITKNLKRKFGIAKEEEVPRHHKRYKM